MSLAPESSVSEIQFLTIFYIFCLRIAIFTIHQIDGKGDGIERSFPVDEARLPRAAVREDACNP